MNIVVLIDGREAVPVRAIPLLTNWKFFTPDVVAQVLAGDEAQDGFIEGRLQAFHLQDSAAKALSKDWWESWTVRELRALSEKIKNSQPSHEPGYQQWRDEALPLLPAGVFVWRDELEQFHARNWNRRFRVLGCVSSGDGEEEQNSPISPSLAAFIEDGLTGLEKWCDLDFSPYIRPALWSVVMEGVPPQQATPSLTATAPAEISDRVNAERKERLAQALEKIRTAPIADEQDDAEVKELLSHHKVAKTMLARSEEVLRNASALGSMKNLEDAEVAVSSRQKALDEIAERIRVMRGDYTESYPAPQTATPSPAPVAKEKPEQRRARWLDSFEAEEKREKRGALQRVADREGVDRSNMSKDIKKARAARNEQNRASAWTSQLVQDGKRTR